MFRNFFIVFIFTYIHCFLSHRQCVFGEYQLVNRRIHEPPILAETWFIYLWGPKPSDVNLDHLYYDQDGITVDLFFQNKLFRPLIKIDQIASEYGDQYREIVDEIIYELDATNPKIIWVKILFKSLQVDLLQFRYIDNPQDHLVVGTYYLLGYTYFTNSRGSYILVNPLQIASVSSPTHQSDCYKLIFKVGVKGIVEGSHTFTYPPERTMLELLPIVEKGVKFYTVESRVFLSFENEEPGNNLFVSFTVRNNSKNLLEFRGIRGVERMSAIYHMV